MTNKYCDHGIYTNTGATPTWGQAQEGDGLSKSVATSATVTIDLSAATAAAGDTFIVMGAVLTCVASGATTNQFNAGAGATLVSNLVTAINRSTNTAVITAQDTGWTTPKIQDAVFARIGTPTTTLEIMTRAGSATYNSSQVAQSGINGITGPWTFSGGESGAWGTLTNTAVVFGSSLAIISYGVITAALSLAGAILPGDTIILRSDKLLTITTSINPSLFSAANLGTAADPVVFIVDNNTEWADGINKKIEIRSTGSGSNQLQVIIPSTSFLRIHADILDNGERNFLLNQQSTSSSSVCILSSGSQSVVENLHLRSYTGGVFYYISSTHVYRLRAINCKTEATNSGSAQISGTTSSSSGFDLIRPVFSNAGYTSVNNGIFNLSSSYTGTITLESPVFEDFVIGSYLLNSAVLTGKVLIRNPVFGGVTGLGGRVMNYPQTVYYEWNSPLLTITSQQASRDFLIESRRGLCEWNSGRNYPALSAVLPNGNKYALKLLPSTQSLNINKAYPFESPRFGKRNTLSTAQRTIKLHFALEQSIAWTRNDIELLVIYTDENGDITTLQTTDYEATALTSDSGSTWTVQSDGADGGVAGQVKFDDSGVLFFDKYKLEVTTPTGKNMKGSNTAGEYYEVGVYIRINSSVVDTSKFLFVDPDFEIV